MPGVRGQSKIIPASYCISPEEYKLYMMINEYRGRYDLPPVPLSKSLSFVASTHVKDLATNHPDQGDCNSHSWSDKGNWKPFCYPRDENKKNSVWNKPAELTNYKGKGYEIVYWENTDVVIDSIMMMWKSIDYFNNFLMNSGKWSGKKWNAIGIGIYDGYASAWFGEMPDAAGRPSVCGISEPEKIETSSEKLKEDSSEQVRPEPAEKNVVPEAGNNPVSKDQEEVLPAKAGVYYIIIKSQQSLPAMKKSLNDTRKKGYLQARLINGDRLRLSLMEFRQKAAADSTLRKVKKLYPDAWIFIK